MTSTNSKNKKTAKPEKTVNKNGKKIIPRKKGNTPPPPWKPPVGFQPGHRLSVGNEGGRPEKYTKEWIDQEADALLQWMELPTSVYAKMFALERGYSPTRYHEFCEKSPKFKNAFEQIREWQESKIVMGGLGNQFNPTMSKFVLANCHKWKERPEEDVQQVSSIEIKVSPKALPDENNR